MLNSEIHFHSIEIGEAIDQIWSLYESLLKSISEIMSWVGGDYENRVANSGEKNGMRVLSCISGEDIFIFRTNEQGQMRHSKSRQFYNVIPRGDGMGETSCNFIDGQ
ncbi:hypothetical protein S245_016244 [Arachis hypogaea]